MQDRGARALPPRHGQGTEAWTGRPAAVGPREWASAGEGKEDGGLRVEDQAGRRTWKIQGYDRDWRE